MIAFEIETMTKKKTPPAGRPKVTRTREQILSMRGYPEFKEWLSEFAHFKRTDMVAVIDQALVAYAKAEGFKAPPDR